MSVENGRTYHAFNAGSESSSLELRLYAQLIWLEYIGPNDEIEQERLGTQ
jgi:hypothetical protein